MNVRTIKFALLVVGCVIAIVLGVIPANLKLSSAFAAQIEQASERKSNAEFDFQIDDQSWQPNLELVQTLNALPTGDISGEVIHVLFERFGLQNIFVRREEKDGKLLFRVSANRVARIGEVGFRGLTSAQAQQVRASIRTRVGLPFILEESERDRESIRKKLAERGYLKSSLATPEVSSGPTGELRVVFPVNLGTPCRIAELQTEPDESLFDYFSTPIELGSLCDRAAIEEVLERQKSRLLSEGFLNVELSLIALNVSQDNERASVRLRYVRGPKTRLEVINRQTGVITDALSDFREKISAYDVLSLSDDELRGEVRRTYVKRGFATAVVTGPNRLTDPNGDSVVRFYVQTGPVVVVGDVIFIGELPQSKQEILDKLELSPGLFEGSVPFVEELLTKYRDRLTALYLEEGYADVQVKDPKVIFSQDAHTVRMIFESVPGYRSVLRDVTILGRPFDFNLTKNFEEKVLLPGQPVNAGRLKAIEDEVRLELMNAGYAYSRAQVTTRSLPAAGSIRPVQVTVDLDPGPLVRIGRVYAEGDVFGKQKRIIQESGLKSGDLFTPEALEQARLRLLKHDLFESVLIEPLSTESLERKDSVLDLVIRSQAKKSYTLGLSPGYGTRSGYRFNVDYAKNNLTSDGLRLTSTLTVSQEKLQNAVLSNQRIMGRKLTLGVMEPLLRIRETVFPFDWNAVTGVEVSAQSLSDRYFETVETGLAWRPSIVERIWTLQLKFSHEWSKAIGQSIQPLEALERPTVKIHEVVLSASLDTRNNLEWPTRGLTLDLASYHARFGLLSDVRYDRYSADAAFFIQIWERLSGAINAGGVKISDVVNSQKEAVTAPSSRRATLAGRSLVRGFPEASSAVTPGPLLWLNFQSPEANPSLQCQPTLRAIGATNVLYAKSELRVRTPWLGESLGLVSFLDTGAAFFTGQEQQALQASLSGGSTGLDPGASDQCALRSARVVGDDAIDRLETSIFNRYLQNSYISAGLGVRYIISNFASLNIDLGFPLREPGDAARKDDCILPADVGTTSAAPRCVKRSSTSKLFGLFPLPGAYHIGIGANF
ncbi:outer membrane protein assembly factor [bacterium]|nr:outer membrane protein assembly factor [bacterium]